MVQREIGMMSFACEEVQGTQYDDKTSCVMLQSVFGRGEAKLWSWGVNLRNTQDCNESSPALMVWKICRSGKLLGREAKHGTPFMMMTYQPGIAAVSRRAERELVTPRAVCP